MAELVDALDSKSSSARSAGSIPARGTIFQFDSLNSSNPDTVFATPRRDAPGVLHERCPSKKKRAQGMPGARCTRGLVCKIVRRGAHEHTGSAEAIRHSPRNGFTAYNALSSATNSSCHRRLRIGICPSPVGPTHLRKLDISNGCRNHTISPYAARLRQRHRRIVHPHRSIDQGGFSAVRPTRRITAHGPSRPAPPLPVRADAAASTASRTQRP